MTLVKHRLYNLAIPLSTVLVIFFRRVEDWDDQQAQNLSAIIRGAVDLPTLIYCIRLSYLTGPPLIR